MDVVISDTTLVEEDKQWYAYLCASIGFPINNNEHLLTVDASQPPRWKRSFDEMMAAQSFMSLPPLKRCRHRR